jgi:hypothetical protein
MSSAKDPEISSENVKAGERPPCFGDPAAVCPRDDKGFFQPQKQCLDCSVVKACLQRALRQAGVLPTPVLETPAAVRFKGFLQRWSRQKLSHSGTTPGRDDG